MDEDVYLIPPGTPELVQGAAAQSAAVFSALSLPLGLTSRPGSRGLPSGAASQRRPLLQADCQTRCRNAATFISSYKCSVAPGNSLSLLFGKPDPADSFAAAPGPSSVFSGTHCSRARACSSGLGVWFGVFLGWYPGLHICFSLFYSIFTLFQGCTFWSVFFSCYQNPPSHLDAQQICFPKEWVSSPWATAGLNKPLGDFPA